MGDRGLRRHRRHIAQRLIADVKLVVDAPAKLSAWLRFYATGQGHRTDDPDAHSITLVGVRMTVLRPVLFDQLLEVLRVLVDRRRRIGEERTVKVCQLHQLPLVARSKAWSRSVTSPASRQGALRVLDGPGPRRSTPPPATTSDTGCPAAATGRSTGCCT